MAGEHGLMSVGEIAIAAETVRREADAEAKALIDHMTLYGYMVCFIFLGMIMKMMVTLTSWKPPRFLFSLPWELPIPMRCPQRDRPCLRNRGADVMLRRLPFVLPGLNQPSSRRDELENLLADAATDQASFDHHEEALLRNILGLQDLNASDVMIPRADIVSVGMSESFSEIIAQMTAANHSRLPVRRDTLDDIAGIIHIKDVFAHLYAGTEPDIDSLLRPALFVAPTIRLLTCFKCGFAVAIWRLSLMNLVGSTG